MQEATRNTDPVPKAVTNPVLLFTVAEPPPAVALILYTTGAEAVNKPTVAVMVDVCPTANA